MIKDGRINGGRCKLLVPVEQRVFVVWMGTMLAILGSCVTEVTMACHRCHTWWCWQKSQMEPTLLPSSPPPSQRTSLQTRGAVSLVQSFPHPSPSTLPAPPAVLAGQTGNSLHASSLRVCWYYQQTVWLCLSECADRTKRWYLPSDNHRVWTSSAHKLGGWCICNLWVGVHIHVMIVASVIAFCIQSFLALCFAK